MLVLIEILLVPGSWTSDFFTPARVVNFPLRSLQCKLDICIESSCKYNGLLLN